MAVQESEKLLQRQFEELSKGLQDVPPAVCITATAGVCSLLSTYWELLPAATTAAYLKRLTGVCCCLSLSVSKDIQSYLCIYVAAVSDCL